MTWQAFAVIAAAFLALVGVVFSVVMGQRQQEKSRRATQEQEFAKQWQPMLQETRAQVDFNDRRLREALETQEQMRKTYAHDNEQRDERFKVLEDEHQKTLRHVQLIEEEHEVITRKYNVALGYIRKLSAWATSAVPQVGTLPPQMPEELIKDLNKSEGRKG